MHVLQSPGITQQFGRGKEGKYPPLTRHSRKWRHLFRGATNLGTTKQMYEKVNGNQKHNSKAKVRHSESVGTKSMALERSMGTESMALRINGDQEHGTRKVDGNQEHGTRMVDGNQEHGTRNQWGPRAWH